LNETEPDSIHQIAWRARCLLRAARAGTLATLTDGQAFASLVTPAVAPDGTVLMLLSGLAAHTRHLHAQPRCALMVAGAAENLNPQTAPRLTITGVAEKEPDPALRRFWVAHHPYAALYADFTDFSLWRLVAEAGHYVGGFARAAVIAGADLRPPEAAVASVAQAASDMIGDCNTDHRDALTLLARGQGGSGDWLMIGVDPDGFDLMQDDSVLRVAFDRPVADAADVRAALVRMAAAARLSGWEAPERR